MLFLYPPNVIKLNIINNYERTEILLINLCIIIYLFVTDDCFFKT